MKLLHSIPLIVVSIPGGIAAFNTPPTINPPIVKTLSLRASSSDMEEEISIGQYSHSLWSNPNLRSNQVKKSIHDESRQYSIIDSRPRWKSILLSPVKLLGKAAGRAVRAVGAKDETKPGSLILLRCGESEWTKAGRFVGWADPALAREGELQIEHAGRLLLSYGYEPEVIYTSRLKRAVKSSGIISNIISAPYLPLYKTWRLNERNYGALTGLKKVDATEEFGVEVVQAWRNSLKARPPAMKKDDRYYPGNDRRYGDLSEDQIPLTESLMDCMERVIPLWEYGIKKRIKQGDDVLVVAHTNTLRGLMQVIDNIGEEDIKEVSMPSSIPFVYNFDSDMKPLLPAEGKLSQAHTSGVFLEKPGLLKEALKRNEEWDKIVPGSTFGQTIEVRKRVSTLEDSLLKLKEEQVAAAGLAAMIVDPDDDGQLIVTGMAEPKEESVVFEEFYNQTSEAEITLNIQKAGGSGFVKQGESKDPVVVFIRHGRTPHNNLGLFTGWLDAPLAPEGVEDAKNGGRLLKMHGFEFDVVYTSQLGRAIDTARKCIDELDQSWLPMVKSWRLNERMYGALTGKSKQMIAQEYGEDQLKKWRSGIKIRPPPVSSFSLNYPGNDYKRIKYVKDLRISWMETIFRSVEAKKFQVHRKFPKTESTWDCMQRAIPFYTERIVPEAVDNGKRVLISSHENAIRGILMHLCEIPEEASLMQYLNLSSYQYVC